MKEKIEAGAKLWGLEVWELGDRREVWKGAKAGPRGNGLGKEQILVEVGAAGRSGRGQENRDFIWALVDWLPCNPRPGPTQDLGSLSPSLHKEEGPRGLV